MTFDRFDGQPLTPELVAFIASVLDKDEVPNLLVGDFLLSIYGFGSTLHIVSFVVPDELIPAAHMALLSAGFPDCEDHAKCRHDFRNVPVPASHLHLASEEVRLFLYKKSEILGNFPALSLGLPDPDDPNIMLASDSRLPTTPPGWSLISGLGAFSPDLHPVRIPTARIYAETLLSLMFQNRFHTFEGYWTSRMLALSHVYGTPVLRDEDLRPLLRQYFRALNSTEGGSVKIEEQLEEVWRREQETG